MLNSNKPIKSRSPSKISQSTNVERRTCDREMVNNPFSKINKTLVVC